MIIVHGKFVNNVQIFASIFINIYSKNTICGEINEFQ